MMKKRKTESGLSMVELMIAALILVVGVITIINMFMKSSVNMVTTENTNQAINLCRQKLEEVKLRQSDYPSLATTTITFARIGTTTIGRCKGTWTITIEGITESETGEQTISTPDIGDDYLKVTVTVVWMESIEHKRRLFTYIGDVQ